MNAFINVKPRKHVENDMSSELQSSYEKET